VWTHNADRRLNLRWTETGGPVVRPPTRQGFGGKIIKQMMVQVDGKARFDWRQDGLVCDITLRT
jgi:two-component sensor histidine kinase